MNAREEAVVRARSGDFLGALELLGGPLRGRLDFDVVFEPAKVFPVDGRDRPSCDAAGLSWARETLKKAAKAGLKESFLLLLEAAVLVCAGEFEEAVSLLDRAQTLDPRDPWIPMWRFRARCHANFMDRQTFRMQQAVEDLDRAIELDPRNPHAFAWRSRAYKTMTFVDRALIDINAALVLAPDYLWARAVRGNIHAELAMREEALSDCEELMRLCPDEAWAWAQTARVRARCGTWSSTPAALLKECVAGLDRAVELAPRDSTIYAWRGEAKRLQGDEAGAEKDFRKSSSIKPRYALALVWLSRVLILRGDCKEAERLLTEAIEEMPENELAPAYRWQARLRLGKFEEAVDDYRPAWHWNSDELWLPRPKRSSELKPALDKIVRAHAKDPWARAWRGRILATLREPDPEGAVGDLRAALKARPKAFWPRLWLAEALRHWEGAAVALPDYQTAVRLKSCRESLGGLGRALLELDQYPESLRLMDAALRLDPEDTVLRAARGEALVRLGRCEEALLELTELRVSIVRAPEGFYWRARALNELGRREEARAAVMRALEFSPDYPEARDLKVLLQKSEARA